MLWHNGRLALASFHAVDKCAAFSDGREDSNRLRPGGSFDGVLRKTPSSSPLEVVAPLSGVMNCMSQRDNLLV